MMEMTLRPPHLKRSSPQTPIAKPNTPMVLCPGDGSLSPDEGQKVWRLELVFLLQTYELGRPSAPKKSRRPKTSGKWCRRPHNSTLLEKALKRHRLVIETGPLGSRWLPSDLLMPKRSCWDSQELRSETWVLTELSLLLMELRVFSGVPLSSPAEEIIIGTLSERD